MGMYNRYLPADGDFSPAAPEKHAEKSKEKPAAGGLRHLLSLLRPEDGDAGDLLLLLILLLVLLDGEDNDLVLILGLALFLGPK